MTAAIAVPTVTAGLSAALVIYPGLVEGGVRFVPSQLSMNDFLTLQSLGIVLEVLPDILF